MADKLRSPVDTETVDTPLPVADPAADLPAGPADRDSVAPAADAAPAKDSVSTLLLRVGYDGTSFSGFAPQKQQAHVRTVSEELGRALSVLLPGDVQLVCAGRTDAGVHARAQYVSLALDAAQDVRLRSRSQLRFLQACSALVPDDICVSGAWLAPAAFSARFDACMRSYRYRIFRGPVRPLFCSRWAWWQRAADALDLDAMRQAASHLTGEHDFASFCRAASAKEGPTSRFVKEIQIRPVQELSEDLLEIRVSGNAFLHNMIRILVGTLTQVGEGQLDATQMPAILAAKDRRAAGPTAPAQGLTFWDVEYPEGLIDKDGW